MFYWSIRTLQKNKIHTLHTLHNTYCAIYFQCNEPGISLSLVVPSLSSHCTLSVVCVFFPSSFLSVLKATHAISKTEDVIIENSLQWNTTKPHDCRGTALWKSVEVFLPSRPFRHCRGEVIPWHVQSSATLSTETVRKKARFELFKWYLFKEEYFTSNCNHHSLLYHVLWVSPMSLSSLFTQLCLWQQMCPSVFCGLLDPMNNWLYWFSLIAFVPVR